MTDGPVPLLLTFADPGPNFSDEEIKKWLHAQDASDAFLSLSFVKSRTLLVQSADSELDAKKPRFAVLYDVTDVDFTNLEEYKKYESTPEEKALLARLVQEGYFNKRTYLPLDRPDAKAHVVHEEFGRTKKTVEGGLLVLVSMDQPDEEDFHKFYEDEHIAALRKVPGWLRSRRYVLNSHEEHGPLKEKVGSPSPPKFLIVNEYESVEALRAKEYADATSTAWKDRIVGSASNFERFIMKVQQTETSA